MSIRRIKAHSASEDGDYIRIEKKSSRLLGITLGALFGGFCGIMLANLSQANDDQLINFVFIGVAVSAILGGAVANDKIVRRVPKIDLVEIKKYANGHVTVVLDDERIKRPPRE